MALSTLTGENHIIQLRMNKFFVPNDVYEDRIAICRDCIFYFKPTGTCKDCGCFMKIKARLAPMGCSQKKWQKNNKDRNP